MSGKLQDFFIEKLNFKKISEDLPLVIGDTGIKRAYISDEEGIFSDEEEEEWDSEEEMDEQTKLFH